MRKWQTSQITESEQHTYLIFKHTMKKERGTKSADSPTYLHAGRSIWLTK